MRRATSWIPTFAQTSAERALEDTILNIPGQAAVPYLWDGTPFVVDVSSRLKHADEILAGLTRGAEQVEWILGYQIFVAGEILPLPDLSKSDLFSSASGRQHIPPDQHIEIRCCFWPGTAFAWWRMILLDDKEDMSIYNLFHELYHILGFVHPDEPGVRMSELLDTGTITDAQGNQSWRSVVPGLELSSLDSHSGPLPCSDDDSLTR